MNRNSKDLPDLCERGEQSLREFVFISANFEAYLASPEGIEEQVELLVSTACPLVEYPDGCEEGVNTWWHYIGKF